MDTSNVFGQSKHSGGLSSGQIAGIVIAVVAVLVIAGAATWIVLRKRKTTCSLELSQITSATESSRPKSGTDSSGDSVAKDERRT